MEKGKLDEENVPHFPQGRIKLYKTAPNIKSIIEKKLLHASIRDFFFFFAIATPERIFF